MDISYENRMNLIFDKPLEYKKVLLYPATLSYYSIFSSAEDCLDVSRLNEKDINLLRLPYLDYMYRKSLTDENFKNKWDMLICILTIVFKENQPFDILKKDKDIYIKVYQRSDNYEKLVEEYDKLKKDFVDNYQNKKLEEAKHISKKMEEIKNKIYNFVLLNSNDFEYIRKLIMLQNDIKPQHYNAKTEKFLREMQEKLQSMKNSKSSVELEDLITVVSYSLNKDMKDMENMTIRRFNRYLEIVTSKDDYYMYKELELNGSIKVKSELQHWIKHYTPKGKFDNILIENEELVSSLKNEKKI